jgi:L-iditol 2-dehydrogenase
VRFAASHGEPGCLCDYFVAGVAQLYPIEDSVQFEEAALFEPMATGLHIVENLARPTGGESYAILGAGPDGLTALCAALQNGASAIYVSDLVPERLEAAAALGATAACNAGEQDFAAFVRERTSGRGVDVAIEAAGAVPAIQQTFHLAAIHGTAVVLGIPPADELMLDLTAARRRELTFIAARRTVGKYERALELIADGSLDTDVMITHRFPLEETQRAFECARDRADGVVKAMILP